jgi:hypothetical protein
MVQLSMSAVLFCMKPNVPAICAWRGFQPNCDFISLKAWKKVKRNPQYAVNATAGV